ncbi:MAG: hypothetical protein V4793_32345, partial [Paraburkholderia tropica]
MMPTGVHGAIRDASRTFVSLLPLCATVVRDAVFRVAYDTASLEPFLQSFLLLALQSFCVTSRG